jgi:hypothetical protein
MTAQKRFQTSHNDKEWFVFDYEDCYCVAGPMNKSDAIDLSIKLNNQTAP